MNKYPPQPLRALNDVAVLLIIFTRTETLRRTFDVIRKSRPSKLYIYQDGPRNDDDARKLVAARQIVDDSKIDWECDVKRSYHTENSGAWASNYNAQKWAFSMADKCIVIEDDSTPSLSFIPFCCEMLNRYEYDKRIAMIAGFNHEGITKNVPYDYLFTSVFSIWGWASWRRVVDKWEGDYPVVSDEYNMHQLEMLVKEHRGYQEMIKKLRKHKIGGKPIYETVFWSYNQLNSGLTIVPTKNMISNTAISSESAHYQNSMKTLPKAQRRLLTLESHEVQFPLRHPKYVIENVEYKQRVYRIMAWGHPWIKIGRSMEELFLNLRYGQFGQISSAISNRWKKLTGKWNYV